MTEFVRPEFLDTESRVHDSPRFDIEIDPSLQAEGLAVEVIQAKVLEYLQRGYEYVVQTIESPILSKHFTVKITPRERHGAQGALIHIAAHWISINGDALSEYQGDLEQSLVSHELVHNIQDEETFPMFLEMIYMVEKGHSERIEQIRQLMREGLLEEPYQDGLAQIAHFLDCSDIEQLLDRIKDTDITQLKVIFRKQIIAYYENQRLQTEARQ